MAIANPTEELDHLELARYLEAELSKENFTLLWEAFYSPESNTRRISTNGFTSVIRKIVSTPTASSIVLGYLSDSYLTSWFHALDLDSNGWVEWADLEASISLAATMRMCSPEYEKPSKLTSSAVYFPGATKVVFVPEWRRTIVCQNNTTAPRVCSFHAAPSGAPLEGGHISPVFGATYIKATKVLLTFGCDRRLCVWDHRKPTPVQVVSLASPPTAACFDKARQWYWVATTDGSVSPFDMKWSPALLAPSSPSLSSSNRGITSSSRLPKAPAQQKCHTDWVQDMMFLEEVNTVITASLDRTIGFWDSKGQMVSQKVGHSRGVYKLVYAVNARVLFSSGQGKEICAWNPFSMDDSPIQIMLGHEREIVALVADVCDRALTSIDASARVVVWDIQRFVKLQVLDLAALMLSASPIMGAWVSPLTRELMMLSVDHAYHVRSTLEASRPPRLGHRVRHLLAVETARVIVVGLTHSLMLFDLVEGSLLQLLDRPFGPSTKIVRLFAYDAIGMLMVQLDTGRVMTYRLVMTRPLPQLHPVQLPLRVPSTLSAAAAPVHELWVAIQWTPFTHRNRAANLHRLVVIGELGSCWTQCYTFEESEGLQLATTPAGAFTKALGGSIHNKQSTVTSAPANRVAKGTFGRTHAALITNRGDVIVWNHSPQPSSATAASSTQQGARGSSNIGVVEHLTHHRVGVKVSSRAVDAMFLPSRNALLLLRPDGVSVVNVGSWTPIIDVAYEDFPDLTDEFLSKRDAVAAAQLASSAHHDDPDCEPSAFELIRLHNVFGGGEGGGAATKEDVWIETNYMGRVVVLHMEHIFQEFFGIQSVPISEESEDGGSLVINAAGDAKKLPLPGQLAKWFACSQDTLHVSATARVHRAVDTRNKEPVIIKRFCDRERFLLEVAMRARDAPTSAGSPTSATANAASDAWAEPTLPGLGMWCLRTVAVDDVAVRRAKADINAEAEDSAHNLRRKARDTDIADRGDDQNDFSGVIVMEMGEGTLQQCMPQPILSYKSSSSQTSVQVLMRSGSVTKTTLQAAQPEHMLTPQESEVAVQCLVHIVHTIGLAGCAAMDMRPRSIARVGDIWKLCGVDSLVPEGALHADALPAAYCPPELCNVMCAKVGVNPEGPSITRCLDTDPEQYADRTTRCTLRGNLWTIAVIAWELHMGKRLFNAATSTEGTSTSSVFSGTFGSEGSTLAEASQLMYEFVEKVDPAWLAARRAQVPGNTCAGIVVNMCLLRDPSQRATTSALLSALNSAQLNLQLDRLFTRPSFFRRGVENALPSRLVATVKTLDISTTDDPAYTTALDLPNCAVIRHACTISCAQALACCDVDPMKSNEGVLHLYNASTGVECGYLPPPEFGNREEGGSWHWPLADEVNARNDAKVLAAQATASSGGGAPNAAQSGGGISSGDEDAGDHDTSLMHKRTATSFVQQLQPPQGWQQMSVRELSGSLKSSSTTDFLRHGVDAAVATFAVAVARKAPFFRGGQVTGDAMPMYAPKLKRIGAVVDHAKLLQGDSAQKKTPSMSGNGNAGTLRKWHRYWATVERQMQEEVGLAPASAVVPPSMAHTASSGAGRGSRINAPTSLKKDFLRSVPTLSHDQEMLPMVSEEIDAMIRNTKWLLQEDIAQDDRKKRSASALDGKKPRTAQSQGVVDDALRTHEMKVAHAARQQMAFLYSDNNLSAMDHWTRTELQARLSSRLSPIPRDEWDSDTDEMERVEMDLRRTQERSERRERAREADLRRRGLSPMTAPSSTPSPAPQPTTNAR
jgi:WD40 repeat protein